MSLNLDKTGEEYSLIFSFFHRDFYQEAKRNMDSYKGYLNSIGYNNDTPAIKLCNVVQDYDYFEVDEHLLNNEFARELLQEEKSRVMDSIRKMKDLPVDKIKHYRNNFMKCCKSSVITHANTLSSDPEKMIEYVIDNQYKSEFSSMMSTVSFNELGKLSEDGELELKGSGWKSYHNFINSSFPTNDYMGGQLIGISAKPGAGKTAFAMNEAANFCKQGARVHYTALGDLNALDFITRISAMVLEIPIPEAFLDVTGNWEKTRKILNNNLDVSMVPSKCITGKEYTNYMLSRSDQYDIFFLDYDGNVEMEADNMYEGHGELYDDLNKLAKSADGKLVFVLSQPKQAYWVNDKLGLEVLAESSRKQQILDMLITIGVAPNSGSACGYIGIAKNRRGKVGVYEPYVMSTCLIHHPINPDRYGLISSNKLRQDFDIQHIRNVMSSSVDIGNNSPSSMEAEKNYDSLMSNRGVKAVESVDNDKPITSVGGLAEGVGTGKDPEPTTKEEVDPFGINPNEIITTMDNGKKF